MKNKELLEKFAKTTPYFWNALFIIIYEPLRKQIPVDRGNSKKSLIELTYVSKSKIHAYLSCTQKMPYCEFWDFSKAIGIDIDSAEFEALKLGNMALEYLENLENGDKKLSTKGTYRKKAIDNLNFNNSDDFMEYQNEIAWENIEKSILHHFKSLSSNELSYLYQITKILSYTNDYDIDFIRFYTELNTHGRMLFKEGLSHEYGEYIIDCDNETIQIFKELSRIPKTNNDSALPVTPQMLVDKLGNISCYSSEYANELCMYLNMDADSWNTLIDFHKVISVLKDNNIPELVINEKHSLIIFLNWLWNLPSLKK